MRPLNLSIFCCHAWLHGCQIIRYECTLISTTLINFLHSKEPKFFEFRVVRTFPKEGEIFKWDYPDFFLKKVVGPKKERKCFLHNQTFIFSRSRKKTHETRLCLYVLRPYKQKKFDKKSYSLFLSGSYQYIVCILTQKSYHGNREFT